MPQDIPTENLQHDELAAVVYLSLAGHTALFFIHSAVLAPCSAVSIVFFAVSNATSTVSRKRCNCSVAQLDDRVITAIRPRITLCGLRDLMSTSIACVTIGLGARLGSVWFSFHGWCMSNLDARDRLAMVRRGNSACSAAEGRSSDGEGCLSAGVTEVTYRNG